MQTSHTLKLRQRWGYASTVVGILLIVLSAGCESPKESGFDEGRYQEELAGWTKKRIEALKGRSGWLNVAGLFWLKEGPNTFGSAPTNDIVFPAGKISPYAGFFQAVRDSVGIEVSAGTDIAGNGQLLSKSFIYTPDSSLTLDHGSLQWFVIKRGSRLGIRLRDFTSENIAAFKGIDRYSTDLRWRVTATFKPHNKATTLSITDITGQTSEQPSPGTLVFSVDGEEYRLDALDGKDNLFIIFADSTNGRETYGSGRFLYAARPDADGKTILDFNKSINPPCAFTAYATCPLPPKQNHLPVSVTAGEKDYHAP